jgi:hypothetical protein
MEVPRGGLLKDRRKDKEDKERRKRKRSSSK